MAADLRKRSASLAGLLKLLDFSIKRRHLNVSQEQTLSSLLGSLSAVATASNPIKTDCFYS